MNIGDLHMNVRKWKNFLWTTYMKTAITGGETLQPGPKPRTKKIAEGGVSTRQRADDVPRSVIHSYRRSASLKFKTDPYKF